MGTAKPREPLDLLHHARRAAANAYAPYSGFIVGAAVETDGHIFVGCNMENVSYGVTICAEVGAMQAALVARELQTIRRIAVVGGLGSGDSGGSAHATPPCGRCRQVIAEFAMLAGQDVEVWFSDLQLLDVQYSWISELLPVAFSRDTVAGFARGS